MKTIKVSLATPQQLNQLVAQLVHHKGKAPDYTCDWAHGGPLKTQWGIVSGPSVDGRFFAFTTNPTPQAGNASCVGATELIAVMRCIVTSYYGETVETQARI